jgi:cytochrome c oxidase assembly protein subunit 15
MATFLLLIVGGLVTSQEAGLAVVDWPNTFGYNMFLYPLSKMTGGIYYEHAHRLFGSLVGLTTLVLAGVLLLTKQSRAVRALGLLTLALVIVQGILGGLRVTGGFTLTTSPEEVSPRLALAVVHGVLGQVVLALLVTLAAMTTPRWKQAESEATHRAGTERFLALAFLVSLVVQLFLGALLRHYEWGVLVHVSMATLVAGLGLGVGVRHWGYRHGQPVLPRLGKMLLVIVPLQLTLGVAALVAVTIVPEGAEPSAADVILTTSHQATGAILLSAAVLAALWTYRLLLPTSTDGTDRVEGEAS